MDLRGKQDLVAWLTPNMDNPVPVNVDTLYQQREVVAEWQVPMKSQVHRIEFEHGTASGKRVIWVDQVEVLRRDWMFKLVGEDSFALDGVRCIIRVEPAPGFRYTYHLFVDGKPYSQFTERQAKILKAWEANIGDKDYRIVLEKDTLNIWLNGKMREETGDFVDDGADTEFEEDNILFVLKSRSSGKRTGILHSLYANGELIAEVDQ